jgi:cardiolipin synthase (CMP-forming)
MKTWNEFIMPINLPNLLTIIRILLTPLFVIVLLKDLFGPALLIFSIAGISDGLDGFIARYFNQRTTLGAYLDPIADKLLLMSAFVSLAILKIVPSWVTVIVISRDVLIVMGIAIFTLTEKKYKIKPSFISKITTVAQITTVILALVNLHVVGYSVLMGTLFWVTAGLTIVSGLHYIYFGMNILQNGSKKREC